MYAEADNNAGTPESVHSQRRMDSGFTGIDNEQAEDLILIEL